MGACYRELLIKTQKREVCEKKFRQIQDHERDYYGSDPYSGGWNNCDGVFIVDDPFPEKSKWTAKKMRMITEWLQDHTEKYGYAKAIKTSKGYVIGGFLAE